MLRAAYAAVIAVVIAMFVHGYEEPTLRSTFGDEYDEYRKAVSAWLPRSGAQPTGRACVSKGVTHMRKRPLARSAAQVGRRYDRLAPIYRLLVLLLLFSSRLRRRAVERLELRLGETVLEVGCGSGGNLDLLVSAVGPQGRVIGVDVSAGMLARARRLIDKRGWRNVTLLEENAEELRIADQVDAVFFGLSYAMIPQPA